MMVYARSKKEEIISNERREFLKMENIKVPKL